MSKYIGGAAFPFSPSDNNTEEPHYGMTLRDYFAAKAMLGILSGSSMDAFENGSIPEDIAPSAISAGSYEIADAMLKERLK